MQDSASAVSRFKFRCDECRQKLKVEREWSGKWMMCPSCDEALEIPFMKVAAPIPVNNTNFSSTPATGPAVDIPVVNSASVEEVPVVNSASVEEVPVVSSASGEDVPAVDTPKAYASAPQMLSLEDGDTALPVRGAKEEKKSDKTQSLKKKKKMDGARTKTVINIGKPKAASKFKVKAKPKAKKTLKVSR